MQCLFSFAIADKIGSMCSSENLETDFRSWMSVDAADNKIFVIFKFSFNKIRLKIYYNQLDQYCLKARS